MVHLYLEYTLGVKQKFLNLYDLTQTYNQYNKNSRNAS